MASRPSTHSTERPCVASCRSPSSCRVFQGVPRPASSAAGHCVARRPRRASAPPQRGPQRAAPAAACVQQADCSSALQAVASAGAAASPARPGRAAASVLPAPPVSSSWAEPFHTVPRGSPAAAGRRWRAPPRPASQRAGANSKQAPAAGRAARRPTAQAQGARARRAGARGPRAAPRQRGGRVSTSVPSHRPAGVAGEAGLARQGARIDAGLRQPLRQRVGRRCRPA